LNSYEQYIFNSRYARWLDDEGRRETWEETVNRYLDFFEKRRPKIVKPIRQELFDAIHNLDVVPSMRAIMSAGKALERDHVAGYNCAYLACDNLRAWDEAAYILMCGTGVGYSVERQYVSQLPEIAEKMFDTDTVITVSDSKIGWAKAIRETVAMAYAGQIPKWDFSRIRPSGAKLKTMGGRASGPAPLEQMLKNIVGIIKGASGRKLSSIEAHDIYCHIASSIVVGGVRRSAMISLSNLTDQRMATAKSGQWYLMDGQRALANNSIAFTEKPDVGAFMREWNTIYDSKSGERGLFNREAAKKLSPERRDTDHDFGTNPCSEIVLRSRQFCNLSEAIARPGDGYKELSRKVRVAAILGTLQSELTDFRYLSSAWKHNCEEERLLGVSITGWYDCPWLRNATERELKDLKREVVGTNKELAKKMKINQSAATTCVKPSGTVSQLSGSASGCHPKYAPYYYRRVRNDVKDPITDALIEAGVPHAVDPYNSEAIVFTFAMKSPKDAVCTKDITAIEHLEFWKKLALNWCEHKPSVTVNVKEHEWPSVGAWCWENFDILSGVSFLPAEDENHTYEQAPYEKITKRQYEIHPVLKFIDWSVIPESKERETELACSAGECAI
jgi:ribonucleoside-diphosphate reductase alpha chain